MGGHLKRRIAGVAISGALIAGVVAVTSMSASGQTFTPASGPVTRPYGTLTIQLTDTVAQYSLVLAGTTGPVTTTPEPITVNQPCATVLPGTGQRIVLSPTTAADTVQVRNNALGVNTAGTSCGSSSAAVLSGTERLTISLGPELTGAGVYAKSASLQVTQVKRGDLTVGFDGGSQGPRIPITQSPQLVPVSESPTINRTEDLFRSITLGSNSTRDNEGVSIANGTSFELVTLDPNFDVAVFCGESVADASTVPGDVATSATYQRLDNKVGTNPCRDVGVRVDIQSAVPGERDSRVFWNNAFQSVDGSSTQAVQAYFTIVWTATNDLNRLNNRVIDYDGEGTQAAENMRWCAGIVVVNGIPIPTLPATPAGVGINTGTVAAPDWRAPWCLVNDDRALQTDGKIVQTQKLFGSGDPWAR